MSSTTTDLIRQHAGADALTESERHAVLASDRRRTVLAALTDTVGPIELDCLAARVAEAEPDGSGDPGDDTRRTVAVSLHHVHLPKLVEAGLLRYDYDSRWVAPGTDAADD